MKITVAYNLRTELTEEEAELLLQEDVDRLAGALREMKHAVTPVEVSGPLADVVEALYKSDPDLIFNVAEGTVGSSREAFYPGLYEQLRLPFTGGNAALLHMNMDKHLAKTVAASHGIAVPKGVLVTNLSEPLPKNLDYPLILKPNSEGSSKGITQDSVVETPQACKRRLKDLLGQYPAGVVVEEFISGRELSVPLLESYPGKILEIVEHTFDLENIAAKYNIYDYDMKQGGQSARAVKVICPPKLSRSDRQAVLEVSRKIFSIMDCPDFGRVDLRLRQDGTPYFIELNPLPSLHPKASLMTAAAQAGLSYREVLKLIVRSAARRYSLSLRAPRKAEAAGKYPSPRPGIRELGVTIGQFPPGLNNAVTDVKGVKVGHMTRIEQNVKIPGIAGSTHVCTGVTAIIPCSGDVFMRRLMAGGFVLNGGGEMAGLTQVLEWGWLESPILLTNSLSVGRVHSGVVSYISRKHPHMGLTADVVLPVVGETDDSYLNDIRAGINSAADVQKAIDAARSGAVVQGSVGAGTGMITCDFAGGIGSSSRGVTVGDHQFTLGVLVLSNFGDMRSLTIDGRVVGRDLDGRFDHQRRRENYGSIIAVVATDAPLSSGQLNRLAKRAALGLGRAGSHAAHSSGEIVLAFSSSNRLPHRPPKPDHMINVRFLADAYIDSLYEAVIEATEEAILNAIFCSNGMRGRQDRFAPAIPQQEVLELLGSGRKIHVSR
ncbi:MAG: P1 family peptidase [Planctomycetota bacterium]